MLRLLSMAVWVFVDASLLREAFIRRVVVYFSDAVVFLEKCMDEALRFSAAVLGTFGGRGYERGFAAVHVARFKEDLTRGI